MCTAHRAEQRQWTKTAYGKRGSSYTIYSPTISGYTPSKSSVSDSFSSESSSATVYYYESTYTISFNANGGSGAPSGITKKHFSPMQPCQLQRLFAQDTPSRAGERVLPLPMRHISRDQHSIRMQTRRCMQSGQPKLIPSVIIPTAGSGGPGGTDENTRHQKYSSQGLSRQEAVIPFSDGAPRPRHQAHRISRENGIMQMPIVSFTPYGRKKRTCNLYGVV